MEKPHTEQYGEPQEVLDWLEDKRANAGLKQVDIDIRTKAMGARVSQSYYSQLKNGTRKLSELSPERMEALRTVLQITPEEWVQQTGYKVVTTESNFQTEPIRRRTVEIPSGLQELIDKMSDKWPELTDPDIQQGLAQIRRRGPGPETFDEWLDFFSAIRKHLRKKE